MKLVFRETAIADLVWFRRYYSLVFPAGGPGAKAQYRKARNAMLRYPLIGHTLPDAPPLREFVLPRTPFSFIYLVEGDEIIVLRLLDGRGERPEGL